MYQGRIRRVSMVTKRREGRKWFQSLTRSYQLKEGNMWGGLVYRLISGLLATRKKDELGRDKVISTR